MTALMLIGSTADAQGILGRLERRARNAAERKIGDKIEQEVEDAIDGKNRESDRDKGKKEDSKKNNKSNKSKGDTWTCPECGTEGNTGKFCNECGAKKPAEDDGTWTCPECGTEGNTGKFCEECSAKKPGDGEAASSAKPAAQKPAETAYAKSDFVPGDEIFFDDDFANEQLGEFPSRWDLLDGYAEIVSIAGRKCIGFTDDGNGEIWPLMEKQKDFLPDVFTLEFDTYINGKDELDENEVGAQDLYVIFKSSKRPGEVGRMQFWWRSGDGGCRIHWQALNPSSDNWVDGEKDMYVGYDGSHESLIKLASWNHFAISFNKRAYKIYVNGTRVASVPNMMAPTWVEFHHQGDYKYSSISNVRLAQGAVPLYDRLTNTGKIVTYAITFDVGKATLKPEADVELNRIKGIMDQDPSIKFEVQGHCDNTGSASVNDKLSQERAEAIVARLVQFGIAKDRLTAVGKGSREPIADNSTDEGRAKNRRVEFVKQ